MEIRDRIAEALMIAHGYKKDDPLLSAEWHPSKKDSAYSMMLEDADIALDVIIKASDYEELPPEPVLGVVAPPSSGAVHKQATMYISMQTPEGSPIYVSDVRAWLASVEEAGIPDTEEVEGALHLAYDFPFTGAEPISCGECDFTGDSVIYRHTCS